MDYFPREQLVALQLLAATAAAVQSLQCIYVPAVVYEWCATHLSSTGNIFFNLIYLKITPPPPPRIKKKTLQTGFAA